MLKTVASILSKDNPKVSVVIEIIYSSFFSDLILIIRTYIYGNCVAKTFSNLF